MKAEISICIPTFNNLVALARLIDSILYQSFCHYEIIITDDSSNFDIQEYIQSLKNSKIKYFKNKVRLGSPENWNEAIRKSSTNLIKLMHHDDYFSDKHSLQIFYDQMVDEQVSIAFVSSINYDLANKQIINLNTLSKQEVEEINNNVYKLLNANRIGSPSATIFRKSNIFFDSKLVWLVDVDFYITTLKNGSKLNYCEKSAVVIGLSEHQLTKLVQDDRAINIFEYFYILQKHKINNVYSTFYSTSTVRLLEKFTLKGIDEIKEYYSGDLPWDLFRYFTFTYRIKKRLNKKLKAVEYTLMNLLNK